VGGKNNIDDVNARAVIIISAHIRGEKHARASSKILKLRSAQTNEPMTFEY